MTSEPPADDASPPPESLRAAIDAATDGIAVLDADGRYEYVNEAHAALYGYERPGELVGETWELLYGPDERERLDTEVLPALEADGHWEGEATARRRDGSAFEQQLALDEADDGRLVCVVRDITDRKRRRRRLEQLHEATNDLMRAGDVATIEREAVDTVESVFGEPLVVFWRYDETADVLSAVAASEAVREAATGEPPKVGGDSLSMTVFTAGEPRLVEEYGAVSDATAELDAPLGTVLMVPVGEHGLIHVGRTEVEPFPATERYQLEMLARYAKTAIALPEREQELARQNEELEQFRSMLAHDLRDPLNTANATLALLDEEVDSDYVADLVYIHDRMAGIVDGVLDIVRTDRVEDPDPVDLRAVAEAAWATTGDRSAATLSVETDATVFADRAGLEHLLSNLFANSVEHGVTDSAEQTDSTIRVTVDACDGGFFVGDDGPGIPESVRDSLFEPGESGDDGTGLGLSIVRRIADAHGWTVTATDGEAGGARFAVRGVAVAEES